MEQLFDGWLVDSEKNVGILAIDFSRTYSDTKLVHEHYSFIGETSLYQIIEYILDPDGIRLLVLADKYVDV